MNFQNSQNLQEIPNPQKFVKKFVKLKGHKMSTNFDAFLQYCEYYRDYEGCRKWLESNMPDRFGALSVEGGDADDDAKKRQKRGGKGTTKPKKKEAEVEKRILLSIAPRGKKKAVTVVQGLKTCGIDLKVASKFFGQKFACGASITGDDEIVIQGDFKDDLFDLIPEKWKDVSFSYFL